jgi:hypothetical protein
MKTSFTRRKGKTAPKYKEVGVGFFLCYVEGVTL